MLILLPVILMLLTALTLSILHLARPKFEFNWIFAAGGSILAFASVFLWQIHFPGMIKFPSWQLALPISYVPAWLADEISWPYALALAALAAAVIWTSVVRAENKPIPWAGTLVLTAFGILAVAAENPLTLLLAWSAIDISELITMLRSTEGKKQIDGAIIAFTAHLIGTGLLLWANLVSTATGTLLDFRSTSQSAGIYLLIAAGLRLGVLPLHLPYQQENIIRRGSGTTLRLVSAAASLALLARIPASSMKSSLMPYLLILAAIAALYAGWMWLRSPDEILGRPFWILGFASLAVAESLLGNPIGSISTGAAMILCGGFLFLFSARRRRTLWFPFAGLWALSALPFSLTASSWLTGSISSSLFVIPFLPAQALMMAGFLRHAIRSGETSLKAQEKWVQVIYPFGLLILIITALLLGFWGWGGAQTVGRWGLAIIVISLSAGFTFLAQRVLVCLPTTNIFVKWTRLFRIDWLYRILSSLYNFLQIITNVITAALEGEGGLLWSFLLLVLILSILSTNSY
jgi:hypothetical protein